MNAGQRRIFLSGAPQLLVGLVKQVCIIRNAGQNRSLVNDPQPLVRGGEIGVQTDGALQELLGARAVHGELSHGYLESLIGFADGRGLSARTQGSRGGWGLLLARLLLPKPDPG